MVRLERRLSRWGCLLLLAGPIGLAAGCGVTPPVTSTKTLTPAPSPRFVLAEPMLAAQAGIPVLLPRQIPVTTFYSAGLKRGFPAVDTRAGKDGYVVRFPFMQTRLPPWHEPAKYRGFIPARTELAVAGARAVPGAATRYLGLPAGSDLRRFPGLAVSMGGGRTAYLAYLNNWGGNGGSLTRLTWRQKGYIYQLTYPAPTGEGGRQAVLAMARSMVPLGHINGGSYSFTLLDPATGLPAYRETVKLSPVPFSYPTSYPKLATGALQGSGQGEGWKYSFNRRAVITLAPVARIITAQASGPAAAGGWVTIQGKVSPAPSGGFVGAEWLTTGPTRIVIYPADQPVSYWDEPGGMPQPAPVGSDGRFTLRLRVPLAIQAVAAGAVNRWVVLETGTQQVRLRYDVGAGKSVSARATVDVPVTGIATQAARFQAGPYVDGEASVSPLPDQGLQALLASFSTRDFNEPYLLPAWVPPALAPRAFLSEPPRIWLHALPTGYLLLEFPPGEHFKTTLPRTPNAVMLGGADLAVYGTQGAGPWGDLPGKTVHLGRLSGTLTMTGPAALLRFSWQGIEYGVRATGPYAATWVVEMGRSMTEVNGTPGWSSNNLVQALGYLARQDPARAAALWMPNPQPAAAPPKDFMALIRAWNQAHSFHLQVLNAGTSRVVARVSLGGKTTQLTFRVADWSPLGGAGLWVQGFTPNGG